jgi:hypothetical protein
LYGFAFLTSRTSRFDSSSDQFPKDQDFGQTRLNYSFINDGSIDDVTYAFSTSNFPKGYMDQFHGANVDTEGNQKFYDHHHNIPI